MLVLIVGNKIWQLWNSVSAQIRSMWLWIYMYATLFIFVGRNIINSSMRRGGNDHALLGEHHIILVVQQSCWILYQVSHEPSDILLTCTWVCMGLDGSTCSESLPEGTCYFEPPGHVSRTSVRAQTYAVGSGRTPCVPRSREHEKDPRPEEKKMSKCQKNTFICSNTRFAFGMCATWNPGVDASWWKGTRR